MLDSISLLQGENSIDLRLVNAMTLAFIGDGVYEILARQQVVSCYTSLSANKLHYLTVKMVRASAQAKGYEAIKDTLTEEEQAIFKRGRNANGVTPPKNSSASEYRTATGLEALFGWLFLKGNHQRIQQLFNNILEVVVIEK